MVSHILVWDILAFNGIIHALASPLLTPPPQSVSGQKWETEPQGGGAISGLVLDTHSLFAYRGRYWDTSLNLWH